MKIEGSKLSRGETDALLSGSKHAGNAQMQEPINVRDAYEFCLEHGEELFKTPEMFMRELHKRVLKNISAEGGVYRKSQVKIAGMSHVPPGPADVEPHMARLAEEIRHLDSQKAVLQHAAEIHSKFTSIHPFSDGNGRTARLIMNAAVSSGGDHTVLKQIKKFREMICKSENESHLLDSEAKVQKAASYELNKISHRIKHLLIKLGS